MATVWPALGESSHGVGKVGVPSPGDQAPWEEKAEKKAGESWSNFVITQFHSKIPNKTVTGTVKVPCFSLLVICKISSLYK